jgi:hypothetical protein
MKKQTKPENNSCHVFYLKNLNYSYIMTRKPWTTNPQREWLEERLGAFRDAQHAKTTATVFFPSTQKAFKEEWPVEPPSEKEIADAGSIQKATAKKNKALDVVGNIPVKTQQAAEAHSRLAYPKLV